MSKLTHLDDEGAAHMVDVSAKAVTTRDALAQGMITMSPAALTAIQQGMIKKGDVLAVARIAGIMGAKKTSDLIPLCHPLPLSAVHLDIDPVADGLKVTASARTNGQTGVEMEALTAVSLALLTIYDMAKSIDKGMIIKDIRLLSKSGGRSGLWQADA